MSNNTQPNPTSPLKTLLAILYGIVYGVALIVPGLSGGTFLVIFGCYDTVCQAFALNFKKIKEHFLFLALFGIGAVGGLIGFVHGITFLLENFAIQTNLFFMGLILGGIPLITKIATEEEKLRPSCLVPFLIGVGVVVALFFTEKAGILEIDAVQSIDMTAMIVIGIISFVAAIAMIMPGISGAFVLVAFGVYDLFMESVKGLEFAVLVPAVIGILLGIVVEVKMILLLLKKYKLIVYSAIIGMVIGSIAPLFPDGFGLNAATFIGIVCLAAGGFIAYVMGKREGKVG